MKKLLLAFIAAIQLTILLTAAELVTKKATDSNGYSYNYVVNDPYNGREYTLKNGLKVFLSRIPVQPRISFKMIVRAGMADSPADATGLAHYFEHMMFKGTDQIGALDYAKEKVLLDRIEELFEKRRKTSDTAEKDALYKEIDRLSNQAAKLAAAGEYSNLISSIGGTGLNAYTAPDLTAYVVNIPAQELEKLLKLESERLRNPVMRLFHTELEAVFEEYNRGLDNDGRLLYETLCHGLYPRHPYGWIPLIGKPEHLKNPSITRIKEFFNTYYVPNNMALLLAGDLDFDKTIRMVDHYFSSIPAGKIHIPEREKIKEQPLQQNKHLTIRSPRAEQLYIGYRIEPGKQNELYGILLADLLANGSSGLMDRNLNRRQKVLGAGAGFADGKDYSMFVMLGRPRAGQSLDQVAELLLAELQKVAQGKFAPELLDAVIVNYRKSIVKGRTDPENAAGNYLDAFVKKRNYAENLKLLNDLAEIKPEDMSRFARSLGHYVRVDKITGKADDSGKVAKPALTPVETNPDKISEYGKAFAKLPPSPLPAMDVLDFKKDFSILPLGSWDKLFFNKKLAPSHDTLFDLQLYIETGSDNDPLLSLAVQYLEFLGTKQLSADERHWNLFRHALDMSFFCHDQRSGIQISGFADKMDIALQQLTDFLANMQPDERAWKAFTARYLKQRNDSMKNQNNNFRHLNYLVAYGKSTENNPALFKNSVITEEKLKKLTGADMVALIRKYFGQNGMARLYAYAGPANEKQVTDILQKYFVRSATIAPTPPQREFKQLPTEKARIFLLSYDSAQLLIGIRTRTDLFNLAESAQIMLFNQYFGAGGLNDIIFQEMRESRSLAYSAYAIYQDAMEKDRFNLFAGIIGTQPDKFHEATDTMLGLFRKTPVYPAKIELARQQLLKKMTAAKNFGNLVGIWFKAQEIGVDHDWRQDIFEALQKRNVQQLRTFAEKEIAKRIYEIYIVGPVEKLDRQKLTKYGEVIDVTRKEIFGF